MPSERWLREKAVMDQLKKCEGFLNKGDFINTGIDLDTISEQQLTNIEGFIVFCQEHGKSDDYIAREILHDLAGLRYPDEGFSPRIGNQYAKYRNAA